VLIGLTSYVPTYLENSIAAPPLLAGLALAALTIGWPISASQSGKLYLRIGFRSTVLIGMSLAVIGPILLLLFAGHPSILTVALCCIVTGMGLGLAVTPALIAAQSSVLWNERGVVTGTNLFGRSIGSAVGVAIFGAIANGVFAAHAGGERVPSTVITASATVFAAIIVASLATVAAAFLMPKATIEATTAGTAAEAT
jgi:MFS family permease